jgi:hypothetical protein
VQLMTRGLFPFARVAIAPVALRTWLIGIVPLVNASVPVAAGKVSVTVPRAPVGGVRVMLPLVAFAKPSVPTVLPARPSTGAEVYDGAAELPLAFPKTVPPAAFESANVSAGVVVDVATNVVNKGERAPALKLVTVPVPAAGQPLVVAP